MSTIILIPLYCNREHRMMRGCQILICKYTSTNEIKDRKAERLPTMGSREEVEGGVEPLPALRAPVMTAAIIRNVLFY